MSDSVISPGDPHDQARSPGGLSGNVVTMPELSQAASPAPQIRGNDGPTQIPIGTPISLDFLAAALRFLPTVLGNLTPSPITPSPLVAGGQGNDGPTQIPIGTPISLDFLAAALRFLPTVLGNLTPSPITPSPLVAGGQGNDGPTQIPTGTPISLDFLAAALRFLPTVLGNLTLTSAATSGTIAITPGMLEFSASPRLINGSPNSVQETASEGFSSQLAFNGTGSGLKFDGVGAGDFSSNVPWVLNGTATKPLGQFELNDHANTHAYSAAEFSVQGNQVVYHAIPGSG